MIDAARAYIRRGWRPVPVPYREKAPRLLNWQALRLDERALAEHFNGQPSNVGVLLGEASGNLVDIDLDVPEALQLADVFLPATRAVFGRASKTRSHRLYTCVIDTEKFADVDKRDDTSMIVEIRSTGGQTVFPGSTHSSGEPVEWDEDGDPAPVEATKLRRAVAHLACTAMLARHWALDGSRHEGALAAAGFLARAGVDDEHVVKIVMQAARAGHDGEWRDRKRAALDTVAAIHAGVAATGGPRLADLLTGAGAKAVERMRRWLGADADGRPEIDTANLGLNDMAGAAWDAIDGANTPPRIFSYAGALAWLIEDAGGSANVEVMNQDHVRHHLADVATFIRWSQGARERPAKKKRAFPPEALAADLLAVRPTLPQLQRLVRMPVFTRDGRLLSLPGFDAASGLYLAPPAGETLPSVPSAPSAAEIDAAREALCVDLLGDFPFVTDADRAHAVALLLTPVLRELIAGCVPLFVVSKPAPRTGAGLLTKVVSIVTVGSPIAATTISRDEEEMRKRLTALLMSSPPMILLDNLHGRLDSAALAAILTTPTWEDRMLGRSQTVRLSVRSAFVVTGNNVALSNEMAGRSVLIRLDPKIEDPSTRTGFLHADLESWAATNRARLLWSALVCGQAWIAAGRPMADAAFGGFAEWAGVLGGVLRIAGIPGFLLNRRTLFDQADEESAHVRAFLADWWKEHHDDPVMVKALIELAKGHPLRIASRSEHGTLIRLGQLVQSLEDRQYNIGDAVVAVRRAGEFRRAVLWRLACESAESCESPSVTARAIAQEKCEVAAAQKYSQDSHTHIGELRL